MLRVRNLVLASLFAVLTATSGFAQNVINLPGTTWNGKEDLGNFGKLTFKFHPTQNSVTMIDAKETSEGAYEVDADRIALSFYNGTVVYTGKLNGRTLSGQAVNGKAKWNWSVTMANAPVVAKNQPKPAPKVQPAPVPETEGNDSDAVETSPQPQPAPQPKNNTQNGPANKITPENLGEFLKKIGQDAKVVTPEVGAPYCVLKLKDKDGWSFVVEVVIQSNGMFLNCPLDPLPAKMDPARLVRLLEASNVTAPCFFAYRSPDNRICMKLEIIGVPTQTSFQRDLQTVCNAIRNSHDLWNTKGWSQE